MGVAIISLSLDILVLMDTVKCTICTFQIRVERENAQETYNDYRCLVIRRAVRNIVTP